MGDAPEKIWMYPEYKPDGHHKEDWKYCLVRKSAFFSIEYIRADKFDKMVQDIVDKHEEITSEYGDLKAKKATKNIRAVWEKYKRSNFDTYTEYKIATQSMNYTFELEEAIRADLNES